MGPGAPREEGAWSMVSPAISKILRVLSRHLRWSFSTLIPSARLAEYAKSADGRPGRHAACHRKPHKPSLCYVVHEGTSREAGGRSGKRRGRGYGRVVLGHTCGEEDIKYDIKKSY